MALQFDPPEWLIKDYLEQKSPVQQAAEGTQQTLGAYAQIKNQEAQRQNDALGTYVKAYDSGGPEFATDIARRIGLQNPPALPSKAAAGAPGVAVGQNPPNTVQMPIPGQGSQPMSMAPTSPIVAHWNQSTGQSQSTPGMPELPGNSDPEELLKMGNFGRKELAGRESLQKLKDSQDAHGIKTPITKEDLLKKGSYDPNKDFVVEPPDNSFKDKGREDRLARAVTDYAEKIEKHPIIKKLQEQSLGLHSVEDMLDLVGKGNTVASSAMGMKMARAMGEVGVITEQDVKRYVQSRKLTQAAGDKVLGWTKGVPSDATQGEIKEIANYLQDRYNTDAQPIYNRYIERFARAYKTTPEDAAYQLNFPYEPHPGASSSMGGSMPQVGGTFEGGKVLKVTRVEKAPKP